MLTFSPLDNIFWVLATFLQFTVLTILLLRGTWKKYPIFTFYIGFEGVQAASLFVLTHLHPTEHYDRLYWITTGLEFVTEVAVILDTVVRLFHSSKNKVQHTRRVLVTIFAVDVVIASIFSVFVRPPETTGIALLEARGNLGLYLFLFLMLTATSWLAANGHFYVPRHLRAIWLGIAISSFMFAVRSVAVLVIGWKAESNTWDYVVNLSTVSVLVFWTISMWRPDMVSSPNLHVVV